MVLIRSRGAALLGRQFVWLRPERARRPSCKRVVCRLILILILLLLLHHCSSCASSEGALAGEQKTEPTRKSSLLESEKKCRGKVARGSWSSCNCGRRNGTWAREETKVGRVKLCKHLKIFNSLQSKAQNEKFSSNKSTCVLHSFAKESMKLPAVVKSDSWLDLSEHLAHGQPCQWTARPHRSQSANPERPSADSSLARPPVGRAEPLRLRSFRERLQRRASRAQSWAQVGARLQDSRLWWRLKSFLSSNTLEREQYTRDWLLKQQQQQLRRADATRNLR